MGESFTYDKLNRLETICTNGVISKMEYDPHGRILSKQADGREVFTDAKYETIDANGLPKPHAISSATINKEILVESHRIEYTTFDKVRLIEGPVGMAEFAYGYDHQRVGMHTESGGMSSTKIYLSNCEIINDGWGNTTTLTYLSCPTGVFAVVEDGSEGSNIHYIYKDHLGSWTTITDHEGNIEQEQSYDAWGNTRDPFTWSGQLFLKPMFDRGFTGHEYLYGFDLINMNGRMYDPVLSSFLSVDSYVQDPDNSQNFNRYAYCLNNPLKYTDPSGEVAVVDDIIAAAIVGAIINGFVQTASGNVQNFGQWCLATVIGGAAGAAGAWAGGAVAMGTGFVGGAVSGGFGGAVGGFVNGVGNAWTNGESFGNGMMCGLSTAGTGALCGGLIGGVMGGINAASHDGNFRTGDGTHLGEYSTETEYAGTELQAQTNAGVYNNSYESSMNDIFLKCKYKSFYSVEEGSYNINCITTRASARYGMTDDMETFVNLKNKKLVAGYVTQKGINGSELHLSPQYAKTIDIVRFKAVAGHELTHCFHHYKFGSLFNKTESEVSAYDVSICTLMEGHRFQEADDLIRIVKSKGYFRAVAPSYLSPFY